MLYTDQKWRPNTGCMVLFYYKMGVVVLLFIIVFLQYKMGIFFYYKMCCFYEMLPLLQNMPLKNLYFLET